MIFKDAIEKNEQLINELEKRDIEIKKLKESDLYINRNSNKKNSLSSSKSNEKNNEIEYKKELNKDRTFSKISSIDNKIKDKSYIDNESLENISKYFDQQKIQSPIDKNSRKSILKHNKTNEKKKQEKIKFETDFNQNNFHSHYNEYESGESEKEVNISEQNTDKLSDNNNENIQIHSFLDT